MRDESSSGRRILVVEDDLDTRESLATLLRDEGYVVMEASDGAEALKLLEREPAPAAILLDLMMPGMDGWQFRIEQRRSPRLSEIPVVALSGDPSSKARAVGSDLFISKPYKYDTLLEGLRAVVNAADLRTRGTEELRADRIASLGTLAAGLTQAVADPLTLLVANLRLLRDQLPVASPDPEAEYARAMLEESLDAAERLRRLVLDVKSFSGMGEQPRSRLDPRAVLDSAANLVSHFESRPRFVTDYAPVPQVDAVERELAQAFFHVAMNAAEAGPPDATVTLRTKKGDDGWAVVEVTDTGSGMDPAIIQKAFDPWFSTKSVGRGLGLSLVHAIVQAHGGRIEIDSEPARGTTVRISLPPAG